MRFPLVHLLCSSASTEGGKGILALARNPCWVVPWTGTALIWPELADQNCVQLSESYTDKKKKRRKPGASSILAFQIEPPYSVLL